MNSIQKALLNVIQGMAIGIANIIPGVSGGTVAVLIGIYEKLINAISNLTSNTQERLGSFIYLAKIAAGAAISILLFTRAIEAAFANFPIPTTLFFIGLVLGSIPVLILLSGKRLPSLPASIAFVLAAGTVIAISFFQPENSSKIISDLNLSTTVLLFFSGFFSLAAMLIPGISGAFILLLVGTYRSFASAVNTYNIAVLAVFALGGIIGLLSLSRLIRYLLQKHHHTSYFGILGLVFGSAIALWPQESLGMDPQTGIGSLFLLIGVAAAILLGKTQKQTQ